MGVSPRRYAGWEPRTRYRYDDHGRIIHTRPEPEWDEWDQVLVDELQNWQSDVHSCGHHRSEQRDPDTQFVATFTVCQACAVLQDKQREQARQDEPERKKGGNPDFPRWWTVDRRSRTAAARQAAAQTEQKTPLQRMQEAVAALDSDPQT